MYQELLASHGHCFYQFLALSYFISFHSTIILVMFIKIVTFVALPGSCHPTKQILTQIVVFVIFIHFAVKLPPYYPSCHCTRPFFVIFIKIALFDVSAVKTSTLPSFHSMIFCSFCQNPFFVTFVGVFGPLLCTMP